MKGQIKNGLLFGLTASLSMLAVGFVYAATVSSGQTLTADLFNQSMVPTGAVIAFNGTTCPDGWNAADGSGDEKDTLGNNTTLNLENEFIRGTSSTRSLRNKENATRVHRETWGSKRGDDAIANQRTANAVTDYDSNTRVLTQTQTGWGGSNIGTQTVYVDGVRVRPQNVALLYCVKN